MPLGSTSRRHRFPRFGRIALGIAPSRLPRIRTCGSPASGSSAHGLYDGRGTAARLWQRIARKQPEHFLLRYPGPLRAAARPLAPHIDDPEPKVAERSEISGDTEIDKVPQQLPLTKAWGDVGLDVIRRCGGGEAEGKTQDRSFQLSFNSSLKVDFQGSRVTSDGGLIWCASWTNVWR